MSDSQGFMPYLPFAEQARDRVIKGIERWGSTNEPPSFLLHGRPGGGKTTALVALGQELGRRSYRPLLVSPPELALDAPLHLAVQLASALRSHGANGALDVVADRGADAGEKNAAILDELGKVERGVLLLDLPRSWSTSSHDSGDHFARARGRAVVSDLLVRACEKRVPVVLAAGDHWPWPEQVAEPRNIHVRGGCDSDVLRDGTQWGAFADIAARLDGLLGDRAGDLSPIELRTAITLLALDYSEADVRIACFGGLRALLLLLGEEVQRRPALRDALRALSLVRFPLEPSVIDEVLAAGGPSVRGPVREWQIIKETLLIERSGGLVLHSSIRSLQELQSVGRGSFDKLVHDTIAAALAPLDKTPLLASRDSAIRALERLHHAAAALRRDVVEGEAFDDAQICELARSLSLAGRKEEALDLYETVLTRSPHHAYARAYVPYHLDHLGRDPLRAETLFRESYEDEPANPWWARRYVCCMIRRGRIVEARDVWLEALGRVAANEDDDERGEWLARNFHAGIARDLLSRGALEPAREVLSAIPGSVRRSNVEIEEMWNRLCHMEEAEHLGEAVFPLTIPFEGRWNGPHLQSLRTEGQPVDAWYPGRVVGLGDPVTLVLAEPPESGEDARLFQSEMPRESFLACARRSSLDAVSTGQFLEVVVTGSDTRIELHQVRGRGVPVTVGFLRHLGEQE